MPKPLSPLDFAFLRMETSTAPAHVGGLQVFKIPNNASPTFVKDLIAEWTTSGTPAGPFKRKLKPGGWVPAWPEWEDDESFDLQNHLHHVALPSPGDDESLTRLLSHLHARMLERHRPLWEIYVIEGLSGGRFALYSKVHHAMIDGVGGVALMEASLEKSARSKTVRAPWSPEVTEKRRKEWPGLFDQTKKLTKGLWRQASAIPSVLWTLVSPNLGIKDSHAGQPFQAPVTILNGAISSDRRMAFTQLKVGEVKAVGAAYGAKVNDVVLAVVGGALRHYLTGRNELPDQSLTATMPIGLSLDRDGDGGNALAYVVVGLGSDIEDPALRLQQVKMSASDAKDELSGLSKPAVQTLAVLSQAFAVAVNHLKFVRNVNPPANLVVTNVRGPGKPLYLMGAKMVGTYPLSLLMNGQALNVALVGYDNVLDFGLTAAPEGVPDPQVLADLIVEEFEKLKAAAAEEANAAE